MPSTWAPFPPYPPTSASYRSLVLSNSDPLLYQSLVILWQHPPPESSHYTPSGYLGASLGAPAVPWACLSQPSPHWVGILCLPRSHTHTLTGSSFQGMLALTHLCVSSLTSFQSLLKGHICDAVPGHLLKITALTALVCFLAVFSPILLSLCNSWYSFLISCCRDSLPFQYLNSSREREDSRSDVVTAISDSRSLLEWFRVWTLIPATQVCFLLCDLGGVA